MNISNDFKAALASAYQSKSSLDKLFVEQKPFIMRLVRHALRYKPWQAISDENDVFQEACIWILHYMWEWDEERGVELERYVVYNIGVRLRNQIEKELRQKRNPPVPPNTIIFNTELNEDATWHGATKAPIAGPIRETLLTGNVPDPEQLLTIRRSYDHVNNKLPLLARELLDCLLLEGGNFSAASRRLRQRGIVRLTREMSNDAFRQWLRSNIFHQLKTALTETDIITADSPRL